MSTPYYHTAYQDSQAGLGAPYRDDPSSSGFEMNNQPYASGDGFKHANGGSQQQFPSSAHVPWYKKKRFLVSFSSRKSGFKILLFFVCVLILWTNLNAAPCPFFAQTQNLFIPILFITQSSCLEI